MAPPTRYSFPNAPHAVNVREQSFTCPHCWETTAVLVDPSVREQTYIEDCGVCCRPLRVHIVAQGGRVVSFNVQPTQ
ncbi:CPXCG motif-containing cysteine-rich protein [Salinibacter ruber]|uniref:CPXCG motif-containing cysteine-rich protein n=1 Tax=Salinibacter ruber TaxID=146919 RepID=UPI0020740DD4|nr:CPXCG motif-containing cysteine-rich protein [Salinibacter ruber]